MYEYGGELYSGTCPNYYCELVEDAGGDIMDLSDVTGYGNTNYTAFYERAAEADIWVYPSQNWDSQSSMDADSLAQLPAVQNHATYDIMGNNRCVDLDCGTTNDWLESRLAEPDVVLEDLINIITPAAHPVRILTSHLDFSAQRPSVSVPLLSMYDSACCQAHERVWLRNVHDELPGDTRTCSGPNDPYDLWVDSTAPEGPAGAYEPEPEPAPEPAPTPPPPASGAVTVHVGSAAGALVLVLLPVIGVLV